MDFNIIRLWTWLNKDKKFLKNEVHARLFPAQLSKNQLEEPGEEELLGVYTKLKR